MRVVSYDLRSSAANRALERIELKCGKYEIVSRSGESTMASPLEHP
jgi:hypothetical protein